MVWPSVRTLAAMRRHNFASKALRERGATLRLTTAEAAGNAVSQYGCRRQGRQESRRPEGVVPGMAGSAQEAARRRGGVLVAAHVLVIIYY